MFELGDTTHMAGDGPPIPLHRPNAAGRAATMSGTELVSGRHGTTHGQRARGL